MAARKPDATGQAAKPASKGRAEIYRRLERAGLERETAEEDLLRDWYRVRAQAAPDAHSLGRLQAEWADYRRRLGLPDAPRPAAARS